MLITDHNVRETLSVTDRAYIINEGKIFRHGTPEQLGSDSKCEEFIWERVFRWYEQQLCVTSGQFSRLDQLY